MAKNKDYTKVRKKLQYLLQEHDIKPARVKPSAALFTKDSLQNKKQVCQNP